MPPTLACPMEQVVNFDANCQYELLDYTGLASVSDNCDPSPALVQSPVSGTIISGSTDITLTATDELGNSTSCTFSVSPIDAAGSVTQLPCNTGA